MIPPDFKSVGTVTITCPKCKKVVFKVGSGTGTWANKVWEYHHSCPTCNLPNNIKQEFIPKHAQQCLFIADEQPFP